jgi:hypothetical protein
MMWLESTGLAEWVRTSAPGYPLMITCHAIGMGIMVGIAVLLDFRLLGGFQGIPYSSLQRLLGVGWVGFGINTLSGTGLFIAQATMFATHTMFLIKIVFVFFGAITAAVLQSMVGHGHTTWATGRAPGNVRAIAIVSIACWTIAITAGRLTAYL